MRSKILICASDARLWHKLEASQNIDPAINGGIQFGQNERRLPFKTGYLEIREIDRGFCTHINDVSLDHDWRITTSSLDCSIRLKIAFAGEALYLSRDDRIADANLHCTFFIRAAGEPLTTVFRRGRSYRYCSISISQDYLRETLGLQHDELPTTFLAHDGWRGTLMGHFPISKTSLAQAARFFNIKSGPAWRDLEIQTISLDLLRLLFEDWRRARLQTRPLILTPVERDKLLRIRDLIQENPAAAAPIPELCSKWAINRNKLHDGFRQLFGISVHAYQAEQRMQMALELLGSTDLPIATVAEQVGYSEPTNFTAAFKRHFAVLPRQVRRDQDASHIPALRLRP
jgi:AraC-like DNA-binding protein